MFTRSPSKTINSVVQMKFGDICKKLQPHGDIERFMKKKELMNAIIGKFVRFNNRNKRNWNFLTKNFNFRVLCIID